MNDRKKIKLALINPPLSGHQLRGPGIYAGRLFKALRNEDLVNVTLVDVNSDISPYNLVHYPYFDPFFLTLPLVKKKPTVVTVHDFIPLKFPEYFPRGLKGEIKWQLQRFSLKNASFIITDSFASKKDIIRFTGISEDKIDVIYLGVDHDFKIIKDKKTPRDTAQKLHLPDEFILYVGDVNYNKNILGLIKVFNLLNKSYPDLNLVLIGSGFVNNSSQLEEIKDLIKKLDLESSIHRIGYIEKADLIGVYNLAKVYVQLSFAEGFGLPVLEAMACGAPVVASNTSSLPEIVGGAGLLIDPNSNEQIAKTILSVYKNQKIKEELIEKGLIRVKFFSWEKSAKETIKVYQNVLHPNLLNVSNHLT